MGIDEQNILVSRLDIGNLFCKFLRNVVVQIGIPGSLIKEVGVRLSNTELKTKNDHKKKSEGKNKFS